MFPKFLTVRFQRFTLGDGSSLFLLTAASDDKTEGPIHHVLLDLSVHLVIFYRGQDVDERAQGDCTRPYGGGFPGHRPLQNTAEDAYGKHQYLHIGTWQLSEVLGHPQKLQNQSYP